MTSLRNIRWACLIVVAILALIRSEVHAQPIGDVVKALENGLPALMEAAEIPGLSIALVDEGDVGSSPHRRRPQSDTPGVKCAGFTGVRGT